MEIFFLWCSSIYKSCLDEIFPSLICRILRILILKMPVMTWWLTNLAYFGVPFGQRAKIRDFYFFEIFWNWTDWQIVEIGIIFSPNWRERLNGPSWVFLRSEIYHMWLLLLIFKGLDNLKAIHWVPKFRHKPLFKKS